MWRLLVVVGVACPVLVTIPAAQDRLRFGRRLSLVAGPLFVSQRDEKASPLRYSGTAPFLEVGYGTRTGARKIELRVGSAVGTLRSSLTQRGDLPRQTTWHGWAYLEYSRALASARCRTCWLVGGAMSARGSVIHHFYDTVVGTEAGYAFLSATLGPVVVVERAGGERTMLSGRLSVPVLAVVARPYGVFAPFYNDPRPRGIGLHPRVTTVGAFQVADFTAAFTVTPRSGAEFVLAYRLLLERYNDDEPFRFASQAVSLALAVRLGGGP